MSYFNVLVLYFPRYIVGRGVGTVLSQGMWLVGVLTVGTLLSPGMWLVGVLVLYYSKVYGW